VLLLVGAATVGIGTDPVITLTPSLADDLGGGERLVGAMASVFGIGAGLGFVVLGRCRLWLGLPRLATTGLGVLAAGFATLAFAPTPAAALTILLLTGVGMTFSLTSLTTLIQQRVTEEVRGRVMALWSVAFLGSRPLAAGTNGLVADLTSVRTALLLVAGVVVLGAWLSRPSRVAHRGA
jgi:predicted MFS family arabinose efflux permease